MGPVVTLYKQSKTSTVHAVDVEAWLKDGWKLEPDSKPDVIEEPVKEVAPKPLKLESAPTETRKRKEVSE